MKPWFLSIAFLVALLCAVPAFALDLHEARTSGHVAEKLDGYVTALKPTPDVQALVSSVNAQRHQEYERISKEQGQPADVVAKLAAQQIINGLPAGSTYQAPGGGWKKK